MVLQESESEDNKNNESEIGDGLNDCCWRMRTRRDEAGQGRTEVMWRRVVVELEESCGREWRPSLHPLSLPPRPRHASTRTSIAQSAMRPLPVQVVLLFVWALYSTTSNLRTRQQRQARVAVSL